MKNQLKQFIMTALESLSTKNSEIIGTKFEEGTEGDPYLFIVKPESIYYQNSEENLDEILEIVLGTLKKNQINIKSAAIFNGYFAKENTIPEKQYYTLNKFAKYDVRRGSIPIQLRGLENPIGSYPFLELFPEITPEKLEILSHKSGSRKLGNGIYIFDYVYKGKLYNILNAFHPYQVKHFSKPQNRFIVLFGLTDLEPEFISSNIVGFFRPEDAKIESIRGRLYTNQTELGIEISTIYNGIHVSPSPLEAIKSYQLYFSGDSLTDINFYKSLFDKNIFGAEKVNIFDNPVVTYNGETQPIFEFCEGKRLTEIIKIVKDSNLNDYYTACK
ncbi:hypothetical protein [Listeria booriae]|uniref:hypothetical protein n=1 Tax=Listeria booriae TaxID=1552123 RepID=UPI001629DBDD|nr:hypothetical protein [Listeria booriae]MBC1512041.1 hypothetical protein [Listeria booriae]MBC6150847.1 hypothetical protein [Listeria booriae]MBC6305087.1 hypothetical protein [Listeria booriae]